MCEIFLNLFNEAYALQQATLIKLEKKRNISNPYSHQEYTLTHRYSISPNTFLCRDLSQNKFHFKVIPCQTYSEVKKGLKVLSSIHSQCQSNAILEIFDCFEVLDESTWYLILVTPSLEAVTLWQISQVIHKNSLKICKDQCIPVLLGLLNTIKDVSTALDCIYPNTVMICKLSVGMPLFKIADTVFSLKISPISKHTLVKYKTQIENCYSNENNDLWGVSLSIYSLIGTRLITEITELGTADLQSKILNTPLTFKDPALERIFRMIQKGDSKVFTSSYLQIWEGLCENTWSLIEMTSVKELEVLHSGLFFTNSAIKTLVIKKLLILGNTFHEVYIYLNENDLFLLFIEECLKIDWKECTELLEAFFKILKQKPKDSLFKEKLGELGILGLIYTTITLDPHNQAFYDFVQDYMSENTLTLMQVLFDSGVTSKALELSKRSDADKSFIRDTMSYYGPNSPKVIEEVYFLEIFKVVRVIQALIDIPYYHKLDKLEQVLELLKNILLKKLGRDDNFDIMKYSLELITEILCLPNFAQTNHLTGKCSSHLVQEIFELSKNPYLYYCTECAMPLCSACMKNSEHVTHNSYNLLYITAHFRCNCSENHDLPEIRVSDFQLPKNMKSRYTFLPSTGCNTTEASTNKFVSKTDMVITTIEPLISEWSHVGSGIVAYYEVKVNKAGKYENIIVGLLGAEVYYNGVNGNINLSNKVVCKAPRFGSYDTVGIGLLRNSKVFFTYNGLLSSYFIDCDANQEIKIFVALYGEGCEVEIKLRSFTFQNAKFGTESLTSKSKALMEDVFKILIKALKSNKENKYNQIKTRFRNLLQNLNREDLIKKLGKFKQ